MIKGLRCSGSTQSRPHTVLSAVWKVMVRSCSMNPARLWAPQHRSSPLSPCSHSEPRAMGTGGCRWVLPWGQQHWAPLLFFWRTNPGMASSEQWVPPGPHHQRAFSAKKKKWMPSWNVACNWAFPEWHKSQQGELILQEGITSCKDRRQQTEMLQISFRSPKKGSSHNSIIKKGIAYPPPSEDQGSPEPPKGESPSRDTSLSAVSP